MTYQELQKIYNFIIKNNLHLQDDLFSMDFLKEMKRSLQRNTPESIILSEIQRNTIISTFLEQPTAFDESTPKLISEDEDCLIAAINIDFNSLNYLDYFYQIPPRVISAIIETAKRKSYLLNSKSPNILKRIYGVTLNSISIDCTTADYIEYDYIWYKDKLSIINLLANSKYCLNANTPEYLLGSESICLNSLMNNPKSVKLLPNSMKGRPRVFRYLLSIGYSFSLEELQNMPISILEDSDILTYFLNRFYDSKLTNFFPSNHVLLEETLSLFRNVGLPEQSLMNFKSLISSFIGKKPTIESFYQIWNIRALEEWKKYREEHPEYYANLFTKIITELRSHTEFADIFKNVVFMDMRLTIPKCYNSLVMAMKEYYTIYHSKDSDCLDKLAEPTANISKYVALYIAASKEDFIKDNLNVSKNMVKPYFKIKEDNPFARKKIIEFRRRKIFEGLYLSNDPNTDIFVDSLIKKYENTLPKEQLRIIINTIIRGFKYLDLVADIPKKPKSYQKYQQFLMTQRIVDRLNNGRLKYDDPEVESYRSYIKWDDTTEKYISTLSISKRTIKSCGKYKEFINVYKALRLDIMNEIKKIEYDGYVDPRVLQSLAEQLPFTDEYFVFDDTKLTFKDLGRPQERIEYNPDGSYNIVNRNLAISYLICPYFYDGDILSNPNYFNIMSYLMVECSVPWILCIEQNNLELVPKNQQKLLLAPKDILNLVNNLPNIIRFACMLKYDLNTINDFFNLQRIIEHTDDLSLAILGPKLSLELYRDKDYSKQAIEDVIKKACYLISNMCKKSSSTIPYVEGATENYRYSMYDSEDTDLLLAGIKTKACFKINNTDNDFLFYSALDKNGFVIKITDHEGNFIARASGFRNGNYVYINQLRTIYDKGNNKVEGCTASETKEIVATLKSACEEMIKKSKTCYDDKLGIDFVFITKSYILKDYEGMILNKESIGEYPMDNTSDDWQDFITNTSYLCECSENGYFTTDFSSYPIICLASSNTLENSSDLKIIKQDIPAIYRRVRNDIVSGTSKDKDLLIKINKIAGIKAFLNGNDFLPPQIGEEHTLFVGDNWYLITLNGEVIESGVIEEDTEALKELMSTIETLQSPNKGENKKIKKLD